MNALLRTVIALGLLALPALGYWVRTHPAPVDARYVGSGECQGCHRSEHAEWEGSLHTKMMRPVNGPGVLVADMAPGPEGPPFDPNDAVWAIGGKRSQQFMGERDGHETLLPGAWEVDRQAWKRVGWDGWQVPVPLQRCHGCHTVGLDTSTGVFVEPNIGCESCHGPSEWHVQTFGLGEVHSSADPRVCGQCHTRGKTTNRKFHFPVGYRPGGDFTDFQPSEPSLGQNSTNWWGNGRERRRHQQYATWSRGGHANSLKRLQESYDGRYGPFQKDCLSCHAAEAALQPERNLGIEDVQWGVTCQVCHNSHGELESARSQCRDCHQKGAFQHREELNAVHVACEPPRVFRRLHFLGEWSSWEPGTGIRRRSASGPSAWC